MGRARRPRRANLIVMLMTVAVVARLGQARRSRSQPGPSMYAKDMMQIVIGVEIGPIAFVWVLWHDVLRRVFRHQVDRAKLQKSLFKLVAVCPQDMWLTFRCAYIPICNGQADCSRQDTSRAAARSWNSASRRPLLQSAPFLDTENRGAAAQASAAAPTTGATPSHSGRDFQKCRNLRHIKARRRGSSRFQQRS